MLPSGCEAHICPGGEIGRRKGLKIPRQQACRFESGQPHHSETERKDEMSSVKPVKVAGQLFWANYMAEFNTKFNEDNTKYECCFGALSEKAAEALSELGVRVKERDPMGKHIVAKSKYVFEPVDEEGNPVDIKKIGNGTKAVALVSSYKHKMSAKYGNAPSIVKLIITELKVYDPDNAVKEETEDVL